ncbi:hypothetical protein CR3_1411 [Cupriavidus gilardii CR3]|nr:hypothetical protein CR3_1411 [Cupriavidus gilardii CR3]
MAPAQTLPMPRRRALAIVLGSLAASAAFPAVAASADAGSTAAADYPSHPLTLIVPWPAGGATDLSMRVLAELVAHELGQPVVVENRAGAGGALVGALLAVAKPDGYTIGQLPVTVYRLPHQQKTTWQPLRDIQPVVMISGYTFGVVVPADSPFRTFGDLVAWGQAHPDALTVGSSGIGTTPHLAIDDVLGRHHIRYVHVPYRGIADQMLAVSGGALMAGVGATGFAPYVDSGRLRLLALFSEHRSPRWPEVPTMKELGYPDAVHNSPYGIGAPRGTDPRIVRRLHDAFARAMRHPRHLAELARYDQELTYLDTARYEAYLRGVWARERDFAQRLGLAAGKEPA